MVKHTPGEFKIHRFTWGTYPDDVYDYDEEIHFLRYTWDETDCYVSIRGNPIPMHTGFYAGRQPTLEGIISAISAHNYYMATLDSLEHLSPIKPKILRQSEETVKTHTWEFDSGWKFIWNENSGRARAIGPDGYAHRDCEVFWGRFEFIDDEDVEEVFEQIKYNHEELIRK